MFSPKDCVTFLQSITRGPLPKNPPKRELADISAQLVRVIGAQPALEQPYMAFSRASQNISNARDWEKLQKAADKLITALQHVNVRYIVLCPKKTRYGGSVCGFGLKPNGECPAAHRHKL
jgi:hypothetical protein